MIAADDSASNKGDVTGFPFPFPLPLPFPFAGDATGFISGDWTGIADADADAFAFLFLWVGVLLAISLPEQSNSQSDYCIVNQIRTTF